MNNIEKPRYKWFENGWVLFSLILLFPFTNGISLFFFAIGAFFRARTLRLHQKSQKNEPVNSQVVINHEANTELSKPNAPTPISNVQSNSSHEDALKYTRARKLVPDYTVLDFETTGLDPDEHEIIQIAAVRYRNHEKEAEYSTYIKAIEAIPSVITRITGITDEDLEDAPYLHKELPKLIEFIGKDTIVAHNASFDMKFLLTNIYEYKLEYKRYRAIDTLALARKNITETKNHKLVTLKRYLKLNHLKSHDALHDCYVTGELYKYCYEKTQK